MAFPSLPPHCGSVISVVDMHTGGEPLRIILNGFPEIQGNTILAKRRYMKEHLDHLRKLLMFEPRGHKDMYGALLVPSELAEADIGVLFLHNEGYSTMCGHAVIALGRFAVDYGLVKEPTSPEMQINIHCPCGLVKAFTEYSNGKTGAVRFHSVPAFAFATDICVSVAGYGSVTVDISYGGALYAFVSASKFGLDVNNSKTQDLVDAATAVSKAVKSQVDRSPTGSGVTARVALQYHKGLIGLNQTRSFQSGVTRSVFTGRAIEETTCGVFKAVVVEVKGHAHYSGVATFTQESDDALSGGFLLR
ncbi:hypothetical protein DNTS_025567 [Danionella cerebrum]|uniref:trans-L-3-hydroxyproline dehydratase n=1 Tax=Danionella cerebrum TaxID=2873325 RepID=A0A553PYS5_9TELE|nr:hypothetical protein DNTS_025567 [Danionella translucida]